MRNATHVPQLHDDLAACGVNRIRHHFPQSHLLIAPDTGHVRVTLALVADGRGFGDDESGPIDRVGALRVVHGHQRGGQGTGCAIARERRHHNAIGQVHRTDLKGIEQRGHGGSAFNGVELNEDDLGQPLCPQVCLSELRRSCANFRTVLPGGCLSFDCLI